uniref:Uncharacterized protein n=1 Tax=Cucumis melo TaxID=3656 RepID=A0A9I9EII0_CUCME
MEVVSSGEKNIKTFWFWKHSEPTLHQWTSSQPPRTQDHYDGIQLIISMHLEVEAKTVPVACIILVDTYCLDMWQQRCAEGLHLENGNLTLVQRENSRAPLPLQNLTKNQTFITANESMQESNIGEQIVYNTTKEAGIKQFKITKIIRQGCTCVHYSALIPLTHKLSFNLHPKLGAFILILFNVIEIDMGFCHLFMLLKLRSSTYGTSFGNI